MILLESNQRNILKLNKGFSYTYFELFLSVQSTASEMSSSITKPRPWSTIDKSGELKYVSICLYLQNMTWVIYKLITFADICSEASTAANTPDSPDTPSIMSGKLFMYWDMASSYYII